MYCCYVFVCLIVLLFIINIFYFIVCFFREFLGWLFKNIYIYKVVIKINEKGGCMVKLVYSIYVII